MFKTCLHLRVGNTYGHNDTKNMHPPGFLCPPAHWSMSNIRRKPRTRGGPTKLCGSVSVWFTSPPAPPPTSVPSPVDIIYRYCTLGKTRMRRSVLSKVWKKWRKFILKICLLKGDLFPTTKSTHKILTCMFLMVLVLVCLETEECVDPFRNDNCEWSPNQQPSTKNCHHLHPVL